MPSVDEEEDNAGCNDSFTNTMVQEANKIKNIVRDTIREKKQKTPAKHVVKTPSKFTVFQDGKENNTLGDDKNYVRSSIKKKNRRSALKPKSTNTNIPPSSNKKNRTDASTLEKPQPSMTNIAIEQKNQQSTSAPQSVLKEKNELVDETFTTTHISPRSENSKASHDPVSEDEGELLSVGSTVCQSVKSEEELPQMTKENNESISKSIGRNDSAEIHQHEDDGNTHSSCPSPGNSVQTFSIDGRSYSIDVSANVLNSIFSPMESVSQKKVECDNSTESKNGSEEADSISSATAYRDYTMRSGKFLDATVSPVSKALAVGADSFMSSNEGISNATAASLIERNKTLVKEVRFADQTCVELSERNKGMERDVTRLERQVADIQKSNDSLNQVLMKSKECCAKLECSNESLTVQIQDQKNQYETKIQQLEHALTEAKMEQINMHRKIDDMTALQLSTEKELISTQTKYNSLQESHVESKEQISSLSLRLSESQHKYESLQDYHFEAKEQISSLTERLLTTQSASEFSAASAAETYRNFCKEAEDKIESLEQLAEERLEIIQKERSTRMRLETENMQLMENANKNNDDIKLSPIKNPELGQSPSSTQSHAQTPTSSVLARTLEKQLERIHDAEERMMEAEVVINETQSELKEKSQQLEAAKSEIANLNQLVEQLTSKQAETRAPIAGDNEPMIGSFDSDISEDVSSYNSCSTEELVGKALSQKLTLARSECEGYKRDLDSILKDIKRLQGESFQSAGSQSRSNDETVSGLLQGIREVAIVATKQDDEIKGLKLKNREYEKYFDNLSGIVKEKEGQVMTQLAHIQNLNQEM